MTLPPGLSGASSWGPRLVPGRPEPPAPPSLTPLPHLAVHLPALLSVRPPSSAPLSSSPFLSWCLLPKRCLCPSSREPRNRRLWQSSPPSAPSAGFHSPRGARCRGWKGEHGAGTTDPGQTGRFRLTPMPAPPGAQRHTRHCTRPHHSQAGPQAGTHRHTSGQETLTHAPTGLPAGGTLSCQELQGSEHSWSEGTPGPDSGTKGRHRCGVRGPCQNLASGASSPRAGLALGSVPLGASHVRSAVWAEKSCLGLSWGHSVLGYGGGEA